MFAKIIVFPCSHEQCDKLRQFLNGLSGKVKSSNYPSNYNDDEYCTWQIQVPVNKKFRLDFTVFRTESGKDFLIIDLRNKSLPNANHRV